MLADVSDFGYIFFREKEFICVILCDLLTILFLTLLNILGKFESLKLLFFYLKTTKATLVGYIYFLIEMSRYADSGDNNDYLWWMENGCLKSNHFKDQL